MTTTPTPTITLYDLTGVAVGPFATGWTYENPGDVVVQVARGGVVGSPLASSDYVLTSDNPASNGGTVTLSAHLSGATGWPDRSRIILRRRTVRRQAIALPDTEGHKPRATERALDRQMRIAEEDRDALGLALSVQPGDAPGVLPADRALRYLAFDAEGAPVASPGPTPGDTPMTDAGRQLVADADFNAMLSRLGGDQAEKVAVTSLDRMLAAPAYSLARSERGRVDALRGVPDLAMARAGSVDISPYVQAVFDEFGPVEVWLDGGTFRWGQTVTLPEGGYLKAEGGKALIRPLAALGACTDPTGGFAIRIARSYCGVRGLRWDGALAGQAGAVVIDCGQITGVPGSGIVHDVVASDMEAVDMAALVWDRGSGDGTANVGRHYVTWVQNNVARRQRGPAFRLRYGLGHLNYNGERKNVVGFQGSSSPDHAALDADFSALSALSDAGGLVALIVAEGDGPGPNQQHGIKVRHAAAVFIETGCYFDGLGGSGVDLEDCRFIVPGHITAAYCDRHAFRFKNVFGVQGGQFHAIGRQGLPGSTAGMDAFRMEGDCSVFEVQGMISDGPTGHGLNRLAGVGANSIGRVRAENGGRRAIQLGGAGGSFMISSASANNNNLTSVDATPNWETTSAFDKIMNYQLPSGAVVDVTTVSTG
ncbi:hypothetical protein [Brevundimonas naejangsanensis]|uniref:hypothetical protein n=2 Tax=Brevundimonas naejangsanensis TaxID=588932 RepID=UPI0026EF4906|nr:hypothetical protein [Brevundimonas naejangsanensis]